MFGGFTCVVFIVFTGGISFSGKLFWDNDKNDCDFGDIFAWRNGVGTLLSGKAGGEKKAEKGSTGGALYLLAVMLMNLTFLERTQTVTDYNIVPFRTIGTVLLSGNVYAIVINIFGNFFIFMPLQFFLIELFEIRKIKQNFLVCFTITFVIEIVQYIFKVGMLDVDDILLCVAGMMSFYYFYGKYRGKNKKRGM